MESTREFTSPAKINLFLHVTGIREDGYHYIQSLMSKISLFDSIKISISEGDYIKVKCPSNSSLEGESNLAAKAAKAILEKKNIKKGIEIHIDKKIPVGGGLGGGSSNAATVLKGLNEMLELGFKNEELTEIGASFGADIPFFIYDGTAYVEGIGEQVKPVDSFPKFELIVLTPDFGISTKDVYSMIQSGLTKSVFDGNSSYSFSGDEVVFSAIHNDLEPFALKLKPALSTFKEMIIKSGAKSTLLSGSGSSIFGIYNNANEADKAKGKIEGFASKGGGIQNLKIFRATTID